MKIDPAGDTCNIPGRPYNSMNSDFGGDLIQARFGHCPMSVGKHVIGVLLADGSSQAHSSGRQARYRSGGGDDDIGR